MAKVITVVVENNQVIKFRAPIKPTMVQTPKIGKKVKYSRKVKHSKKWEDVAA